MWSRRPDGVLVRELPAFRQAMPLIMRTRTESAVYFDMELDLSRAEPFLEDWNAAHPGAKATLFHLVVWGIVRVLHARPELNRFVAGGKHWQRDGVWVSFAAKTSLEDEAPLLTLKRRFEPTTLEAIVQGVRGDVRQGRAGRESASDRELRWLLRLPVFLRRWVYRLSRWLDRVGLIPRAVLATDPLYTSVFVANLGSLKMDACYHHLYEHGTASVFCVVGRRRDGPRGPVATLRFTLDERVTDGLYAQRSLELLRELIEDPAAPPVV